MGDIISFKQKKAEKEFDRDNDPCSSCTDKTGCTCEKADLWWRTLINQVKGK